MKYSRFLENKTRMTIKGKRYRVGNPNHPFHHVYQKEGHEGVYMAMGLKYADELAKEIKRRVENLYDEVVEGEVYIIRNSAWPEWQKIGKAVDAKDRLKGYQTGSPKRDYELIHAEWFSDRHVAEKAIHTMLEQHKSCHERRGEWFKSYDSVIKGVMREYKETQGQAA
jgi:hypothetical protein